MSLNQQQQKPSQLAQTFGNIPTTEAKEVTDVSETIAEIEKAVGQVTIMHGANDVSYPIVGKSVQYARENLTALLNIPKDAVAYIDGTPVTATNEAQVTLQDKQTLEFIKAAGTKGAL